jgi:hypothetical protein
MVAQHVDLRAGFTAVGRVLDRYPSLTAFENGTMNDTTCALRIVALETKIIQLEARHAELIDILSAEPTTPARTSSTHYAAGFATSSPSAHPHSARS